MTLTLLAGLTVLIMQAVGNPIVQVPSAPQPEAHTSSSGGNVSVTVTPPPPDPAAAEAIHSFLIASDERDHVQAPVDWANGLLKGANIWTRTPPDHFNQFLVQGMRNSAKTVALGLFSLGIIYVGIQLIMGSAQGTTSAMQLLPLMIAGFMIAVYAETITNQAIALNNWMCSKLGEPSMTDFVGNAVTLPPMPEDAAKVPIPPSFFSGVVSSLLVAIVLLILEMKMIFREAVLIIGTVVMPISGVLWAFKITRGWGLRLFSLFFGWLFGQPLVVICLALGSSFISLFNVPEDAGQFLVKIAILIAAIKVVSIFAGMLGAPSIFGLAGLLFLMRRGQMLARRAGGGPAAAAATPRPTVQSGQGGGTGAGSAATGRPWRPALGSA